MTFEDCFETVLEYEGGYVYDERDPGGETKFGITKRSYPNVDIASLTIKDAAYIYRRDYWNKCWCDRLPVELRLLIFDSAVNLGVRRAVKILQKSAGVKKVDGIMGPQTFAAVETTPSSVIIDTYVCLRFDHYARQKNWQYYGKGWSKRLLQVALISAFNIVGPEEIHLD